jgi:hypothetical protein
MQVLFQSTGWSSSDSSRRSSSDSGSRSSSDSSRRSSSDSGRRSSSDYGRRSSSDYGLAEIFRNEEENIRASRDSARTSLADTFLSAASSSHWTTHNNPDGMTSAHSGSAPQRSNAALSEKQQDEAAEKNITEVRNLIDQGFDIDGVTINRNFVTYQFDLVDDPAFQPGDMGIRTIMHSGITNWDDLGERNLLPKNFKRGKIEPVITETTYALRGLDSGLTERTFTSRAGDMWRPPAPENKAAQAETPKPSPWRKRFRNLFGF